MHKLGFSWIALLARGAAISVAGVRIARCGEIIIETPGAGRGRVERSFRPDARALRAPSGIGPLTTLVPYLHGD